MKNFHGETNKEVIQTGSLAVRSKQANTELSRRQSSAEEVMEAVTDVQV